ncbi:ABC transporter substrate-binding protein [Paracoccus aurantiacus]|uniref:ABC transporter substrate-binding protein n=1 Tax=Paracoccus aurantiacus TaxID=2599412 RepID=A0A5C6S1C1_9RHOB|nr:ABC transporter substrate-binding protein [Paracoccus aurantiacus]TXB68194.1 ABC transporter substrate-binding protein [Paracoccus aurantiacus]
MVKIAAALLIALASAAVAAPQRVVSMNLCTDQLAMLIAAPGQLVSVSWLAADPSVSVMADKAADFPLNHGAAEELFLDAPDLVLAGTYSTGPATDMLRRLGIRVETLPPANSVSDIRHGITDMGALLDQPERAARVLAQFDADLAAIRPGQARLAATYAANGFTTGPESLSGDAMSRAGLVLLADRLGLAGGQIALEQLVMAAPELLVTGSRYSTPSRAESVLDHPAFTAIPTTRRTVPDRDWICGLPAIAGTIADLSE